MRKEIASLPGWQPLMMELHVSGYNYWEIAGKLQLEGKYVLRELTRAYSTLRARERKPARMHKARTMVVSGLVRRFT